MWLLCGVINHTTLNPNRVGDVWSGSVYGRDRCGSDFWGRQMSGGAMSGRSASCPQRPLPPLLPAARRGSVRTQSITCGVLAAGTHRAQVRLKVGATVTKYLCRLRSSSGVVTAAAADLTRNSVVDKRERDRYR